MTHTCNRCRTQYESGSFYGGHDYCMSCYVAVRQEEEQRKRKEEALKEEAAAKIKREREKRIVESEMKKRDLLDDKKRDTGRKWDGRSYFVGGSFGTKTVAQKKKDDEKELAKRRLYDDWKKRLEVLRRMREKKEESAPQRVRRRAGVEIEEDSAQEQGIELSSNLHELIIEGPSHKATKKVQHLEGRLELSVRKGLPVSLSIGQKKNKVALAGNNISAHRVDVELFAIAEDASGKRVECKIEPKHCTIEANEKAEFEVQFDLEENAARGNLKFEAYLKERAVYLEGGMGRSNPLSLGTNVKTPMQLEYKKGSVKFEGDGISLLFDNVGESGGILNVKSKVEYGAGSANLKEKKSVKGYEKKVQLEFSPAKRENADNNKVFLFGVDANGKEYRLVKTIKWGAQGQLKT